MFMRICVLVTLLPLLVIISSCTPGPPYEIKSPCVSTDTDNPWAHNPCIRKPMNRDIA